MSYIAAIGARYLALAVQFVLVILVTNTLPPAEAGVYFATFGVVTTLFCLAGVGVPDGLVRTLGDQIATGQRYALRRSCWVSLAFGIAVTGAMCVAGSSILLSTGKTLGGDAAFVVLAAVWLFVYGAVFIIAQALVALRAPALGSFFFYSAINLCILCTSIPYLALAQTPNLFTLVQITVFAASVACAAGLVALILQLRKHPAASDHASGMQSPILLPAFKIGAPIAMSRMLQSMIYWIPVWVAAALLSAADGAVIGAAGRLLIAVTAVIAALRFSVRPAIVAAAAEGDWPGIERTGRKICLITTGFTLVALICLWAVGAPVLAALLGPEYGAAWVILAILMIGALGEAFGGPVDEILKMTGAGAVVLFSLIVTVSLQAILATALAPLGLNGVAAAQALAFCSMYAFQVAYLYRARGILVMPLPPRPRGAKAKHQRTKL
ncbi:lipopolysaccharide biosynthesis protein [Sulfitobacter sp. D7]|uniref:lipopolysaccharide biosynthesis protein n=1 Tax=Sulfitobacter sp. D7 TaxID=1968541 RepID=UPI000E77C937|nr:lipopolysaccharide biosynthesis protein [Sulfitobacter sp. D7]AYE85110.1 hypothetical protein B5M07_02700 [Sulfitobacter sp. D7]